MISVDNFEDHSSSVYDKLAGIRSAFEILIEKYGYDEISLAMGRVVEVLEEFEQLAAYKRQSKLQLVNSELRLEEEKEARALEIDSYRCQARQLQERIEALEMGNRELCKELVNTTNQAKESKAKAPEVEDQSEAIAKLNDVIEVKTKQRNEIRQEYEELSLHSERQSSLILKLKVALQESVHSQRTLQARNDTLCNELARLEAQIAENALGNGMASKLETPDNTCSGSVDSVSQSSVDSDLVREDASITEAKLQYKKSASEVIREALSSYSPKLRRRKSNKCTCDQAGFKFNVDEMTILINERNIAKEKLISLEEDLAWYKSKEVEGDGASDPVTEEGFAMLDPPPSTKLYTRTLFPGKK